MKIVVELDDVSSYEDTITEAIRDAIQREVNAEVRKQVKAIVEENKKTINAATQAYVERVLAYTISSTNVFKGNA